MVATHQRIRLFEAAPGLLEGTDPRLADSLRQRVYVDYVDVTSGPFSPGQIVEETERLLAVVVLRGLLLRAEHVANERGLLPIGPGDVTNPWSYGEEPADPSSHTSWESVGTARLAVVDDTILHVFPGFMPTLLRRMASVERTAARDRAISHLDAADRLLDLLSHLARRWGLRRADGAVAIPFKLSHELVADMLGLRRGAISKAADELAKAGNIGNPSRGTWVFHQQPAHTAAP